MFCSYGSSPKPKFFSSVSKQQQKKEKSDLLNSGAGDPLGVVTGENVIGGIGDSETESKLPLRALLSWVFCLSMSFISLITLAFYIMLGVEKQDLSPKTQFMTCKNGAFSLNFIPIHQGCLLQAEKYPYNLLWVIPAEGV